MYGNLCTLSRTHKQKIILVCRRLRGNWRASPSGYTLSHEKIPSVSYHCNNQDRHMPWMMALPLSSWCHSRNVYNLTVHCEGRLCVQQHSRLLRKSVPLMCSVTPVHAFAVPNGQSNAAVVISQAQQTIHILLKTEPQKLRIFSSDECSDDHLLRFVADLSITIAQQEYNLHRLS